MADHRAYRRQTRDRRKQNEQKPDAVVTALTAQVLICILLLLLAVLASAVDEERYSQVRREYESLVTDSARGREVLGELTAGRGGGVQGAFQSLEEKIHSIVERFAGDRLQEQTLPQEEVSPTLPEEPAEREIEGDGEEQGEGEAEAAFGYNYLKPSAMLPGRQPQRLAVEETGYWLAGDLNSGDTAQQDGSARGGAFPVQYSGGTPPLSPPEGATFAAVELNCQLLPPTSGLITSPYSYRDHPISGEQDFHTGIDIAAEEGRNILAVLPGTVEEVGESNIYGKHITLRHSGNFSTFYAHCSEQIVQEGMAVRQGERIGKVGSTGVATGPHLHFSVLVDEQFTDPYWVLKDNIQPVE